MAQEVAVPEKEHPLISKAVKTSAFASAKAAKSLRVCCFGSSSSLTPEAYLRPSAEVGYLLAVRGHVCVNGAGTFGCMAAMNEGALHGDGNIVGVIHEMWLKQGEDVKQNEWGLTRKLRDGGAHAAFANVTHPLKSDKEDTGPIRELLVAGGKDLQERKRLLLQDADALVVMPGGPGTFDELWEVACSRNIGLSSVPIVCVNIDGFYDPFLVMLQRAWDDKLTKLPPHQIIHLADTAEEAIEWVEHVQAGNTPETQSALAPKRNEKDMLRWSSILGSPSSSVRKPSSTLLSSFDWTRIFSVSCIFALGIAVGSSITKRAK